MKKYLILTAFISVSFCFTSKAQQSLALLQENIYSTNYNPGKPSLYKWHVGIPLLSNFNILINENLFTYKKLIVSTDTSKIINPRGLLNNLKRQSSLQIHLNEEIIGFGFRIKEKSYVSFSTRLRSESYVFFPNELMKMFIEGNAEYIGENVQSKPSVYHSSYLEIGVAYQYTLNKNYTFGLRPKLLFGISNIHTTQSEINFLTTQDWSILANGKIQANTYLPLDTDFNFQQEAFIAGLFKNVGMAFDLGTTIKLPYDLGIAVGITDLGFIKWKNAELTQRASFQTNDTGSFAADGNIYFNGLKITMQELVNGEFDDATSFLDSLNQDDFFTASYQSIAAYTSSVYPKVYIEAFYKLSKFRFSVLSRTDFVGKRIIPSFTFGCSGYFGNIVELALSYSIYNRTYSNVGFGFHFHFGPVQWYCSFDNFIAPFIPLRLNNFSLQSGLYLGIRPKKEKKVRSSEM